MWKSSFIYAFFYVYPLSQEQNQAINQSLALFPSSSETGKYSVARWLLGSWMAENICLLFL